MDDEQPVRRSRRHDGRDAWSLRPAEAPYTGALASGDLVNLVFVRESADAQGREEALWVAIVRVEGDVIDGELDNQPTWIRGLGDGDAVSFGRPMIHDVMRRGR